MSNKKPKQQRITISVSLHPKLLAAIEVFAKFQGFEGNPKARRDSVIRAILRERMLKEGIVHYPNDQHRIGRRPDNDTNLDFGPNPDKMKS